MNKIQNLLLKAILSFLRLLHCDFLKYCTQEQLFCQTDSVRFSHRSVRVSHQFSDFKIFKSLVVHRGSQKNRNSAQLFHRKWRNNNNKGGNLLINFQKLLIRPIWMFDYMVKRHTQPFYVYHLTGNVYRFSY